MSNYINNLNNFYGTRYSYSKMVGKLSGFNNAELNYSSKTKGSNGYVNDTGLSYLNSIQEGAKQMAASLKEMTSASTFQKLTAASSNKESLSIDPSSAPTSSFKDATVSIQQLAGGQINTGEALKSAETYTGGLGKQSFELEVDGKTTSLSIEVKAGDTNKAVQQKMADAVNASGSGVSAQLILNTAGKTTALSIQSDSTGDNNASRFAIRDRSGSTVVRTTGASALTQAAQDARYTVNSEEKTSSTNKVNLGNEVKAVLQKATEEPVTVSAKLDTEHAQNKVRDMVSSFSSLLDAAKDGGKKGNNRLYDNLRDAATTYAKDLEKIGVSVKGDGSMSLDSAALAKAAEKGDLEKVFAPYEKANFGLVNRLDTIARNVERNPAAYVVRESSQPKTYDPYSSAEEDTLFTIMNSKNFNLTRFNNMENNAALLGLLFNLYA